MTYIVMTSVVCFSCFFRREKQEKQRKKPLRTVRCKADVHCKAVSKFSNAKATVRYKADDVSKAGWSNFKRQGNSPLRNTLCVCPETHTTFFASRFFPFAVGFSYMRAGALAPSRIKAGNSRVRRKIKTPRRFPKKRNGGILKNDRGVEQAIYSENSSNGLPVARSIQTKRPPCSRTNECGEFSLGSDTEPQFR